jgi:hypothetical protein
MIDRLANELETLQLLAEAYKLFELTNAQLEVIGYSELVANHN